MESPSRHLHRPVQRPSLRGVFAPLAGTEGGRRKSGRGAPFVLTIPGIPPSMTATARTNVTPRQTIRPINDENTPHASRTNTVAVLPGDQTIFAPSAGDDSLLMEQRLPSYKDLWDSEEEGDEIASFLEDSMADGDGSVGRRGGRAVGLALGRKSILGQSMVGNRLLSETTKSEKERFSTSKLGSLYKPTPKRDSSSRRRSTIFGKTAFDGLGGDVLVPLYAVSSPVGEMEAPMVLAETGRGTDTEEEGEADVDVADEEVCDRQSGQAFPSQASLASASQAIPELTQGQPDLMQRSPLRTATPPRSTTARRSPDNSSGMAVTTPRMPVSAHAASKKRTPSHRPETGGTPIRGVVSTVSAKDSPNPRARKTARKSTRVARHSVGEVPSSPAVPLAVEARVARLSASQAPSTDPSKPKSRRRSTAVPVAEKSARRPRAARASHAPPVSQPVIPKTRRLSGRKSTGSIPTLQNATVAVKRTRHSLSASAGVKGESPKARRRPRQSLAPLELVERVGLLDIPQRPASPTEDPLLLVPSARRSVGGSRGDVAPSRGQRGEGRDDSEDGETAARRSAEPVDVAPIAPLQVSARESFRGHESEADDRDPPLEDLHIAPVPSTPSSHSLSKPISQPRALGSSPWVSANLSIFSPAAMESSPVRPSPVRWRIASPLPEALAPETIEPVEPEQHAEEAVASAGDETAQTHESEERSASRQSTPKCADNNEHVGNMSPAGTLVGETDQDLQYQDVEADHMSETEWRAYQREDSPISSHDGDAGEAEEESGQLDDISQVEKSDDLLGEDTLDLPGDPSGTDRQSVEPDHEQGGSPGRDTAMGALAAIPEDSLSTTQDIIGSDGLPHHSTSIKKRVGRICLRLPLDPVIVKIEPAGENVVRSHGLEKAEDTSTEEAHNHDADSRRAETRSPSRSPANIELDYRKQGSPSAELPSPIPTEADLDVSETAAVPPATDVNNDVPPTEISPSCSQVAAIVAASPSATTQSSATLVREADSPFQAKSVADAVVTPVGAGIIGGGSPKRVFRESVSSVSVSSEDPRAAARAAALLKLHHHYLNEGPGSEPMPSGTLAPTPQNVNISPRKRRISQYFQSAETASSLTLPELLQEAELELVDTTSFDVPAMQYLIQNGSAPVYSPFPMPGSWSSINNRPVPVFQQGRTDFSQWIIEDWKDLERCYKRVYKKRAKGSCHDKHTWNLEDSTEVINNLCKLKRIAIADLRDEWASETLRLRINTLQRKRKGNDLSAVDVMVVASSTSRSPKRLKANDASIVEYSAPATPAPPSRRLMRILSQGWRSVLQIIEPSKRLDSRTTVAAQVKLDTANQQQNHTDLAPPSTPQPAPAPPATNVKEKDNIGIPFTKATPVAGTPLRVSTIASSNEQTPQPEMQQVTARRASVLARARAFDNAIQSEAILPLVPSRLIPSTSASKSIPRRSVVPDASSSRPIVSLPRRSLVSQEPSPSVKNIIQSFERSFEADDSASDKIESPASHELRRLSSRRSVSGSTSLREVLERSMGSGK